MTSKAVTKRAGRTGAVSITPAGLTLVAKMAADGCALSTIAKALRIAPNTFRALRKADETLADAVEVGRAAMETELVSLLMAQARKGNTTAAIFLLKGSRGWKEGEMPKGETVPGTQINISIPQAMSKEEFAKLVEVEVVPEPPETQTPQVIR